MLDDRKIILPARSGKLETLSNGEVKLTVYFDQRYAQQAARSFHTWETPIAVARLRENERLESGGSHYGEAAKQLRLSGFFRSPEVWKAVGSDEEFLTWLRTQDCALKDSSCQGEVVPAHVRRVASGAGTGIKPEYSAIPLCHTHHSRQHQAGESAIGGKDFCDRLRIEYLVAWCWQSLKQQLGFAHWSQVPPYKLNEWAREHELSRYLPEVYREAA